MNDKNTKTVYSFLGLPASGKGTQTKIFSDKMHAKVIGTGDLVRQIIDDSSGDPFVQEIQDRYNKGIPQPDDVIIDLVKKYLEHESLNVIFDNFPFSTAQSDFLTNFAQENDWNLVLVYIKISAETAIKRVVMRKICADCGQIAESTDEMICDKCGGALIVRSDDNEETAKKRIDFYEPRINEVLDYYLKHDMAVIEVNGEGTVKEVRAELSQKI